MTTPAQSRRRAKTGAIQQRILDAATEVFATRGFTAATMADVVAGSDASIGSIYSSTSSPHISPSRLGIPGNGDSKVG